LAAGIGSETESDAAFVGVVVPPVEAVLGSISSCDERPGAAHGVPAWRFHLDDVGAHVSQQLTAVDTHVSR